jgi:aldehyde dehydrogenase (NAD+)
MRNIAIIFSILKQSHQKRILWPLDKRLALLNSLNLAIDQYENNIYEALYLDLGRSKFESYTLELAIIKRELNNLIRILPKLYEENRVGTPLIFKPGSSVIKTTPKGVVLIISPWNYPFQLSILPLIAALAAGNCVILKPSELAVKSAEVLGVIIESSLSLDLVRVVNGDEHVAKELLDLPLNHIFYTGNSKVGIKIMQKAAEKLIPLTLELGGKSPVLIDENCRFDLAVKRILWGKCLNAGQTCIAPDYVLLPKGMSKDFVLAAQKYITVMFGDDVEKSPHYGRIINQKHFDRLVGYLHEGIIALGGNYNKDTRFIAPTLLIDVKEDAPLMRDEIFGPLLPLIEADSLEQAIDFINNKSEPLALYVFSNDRKNIKNIIKQTTSGSVGINDVIVQGAIDELPFGGVGQSGFGNYHGAFGFYTFSHLRAIYQTKAIFDNPIRYAPYDDYKLALAKMAL